MARAEAFFNKHGGKTIVIARFMPFIRTFIPFVAGASRMNYRYFIIYNVVGAFLWVGICTILGYYFGNIPIVKDNFSTVLLAIIFISVLPVVIGLIRGKLKKALTVLPQIEIGATNKSMRLPQIRTCGSSSLVPGAETIKAL